MYLNRLFIFLALLLTLPISVFGQKVPVAPNMLLDIGGVNASATPHVLKFDAHGNMYVAGEFAREVDFDPSAGVTSIPWHNVEAYVAKYNAAGALVWAKSFDMSHSYADGLDIDRSGNVTVIGQRAGSNVEAGDLTDRRNAFILHLDDSGNVLWKKFIVGTKGPQLWYQGMTQLPSDIQTGYQVSSDDTGNLIATFTFSGSPDVGGKITAKGNIDGLVVKYDTNGNIIWKFSLGATGGVDNSALTALVDKNNNIIVAGYTNGTVDYNPLGTPVNLTKNSSMYIAKYSPAGLLQWIKSIDGYMVDYNIKLALDGQDNIYINGTFISEINFGIAPTLTPTGYQDIFIAKYSSGGNLLYHKSIGGTASFVLNSGLVAGSDNSLYLTGNLKGKVDFDPSSAGGEINSDAENSAFLAKYDENGNNQWAFGIQGIDNSDAAIRVGTALRLGAQYVNVNSQNEILLTGSFSSTVNFDGTGCGVSNMTAKGSDMFIVRYTPTTLTPITNNAIAAPAVSTICPDVDPALIAGSTPVGNVYTYQWQQSLNNTTYTDIPGAVSKDFDPPVITATTYYRRRLVSSVCAAPNISNVVTITLSKPATGNTVYIPAVSSFCNAGNAGLIVGSPAQAVGNIDYQWQQSTDNVTFTNISGATARDYDPPSASVTTYYRRLVNNAPCSIAMPSNVITISVTQVPVPTISAEQTLCLGNSVTLNVSGGTQYSWSPAAGLSATDIASPTATPSITTTYTVTVSNGACSTTLPVKVTVVERPTVNAGTDKDVIGGDRIQLDAQVTNAEGATYSWTPATYLDNPAIANPTATPQKNITYRLTVTSAKGCFIASDEVTVNVHEQIIIPNTFTPNGDGTNDTWNIDGLNSHNQGVVTVFNRNGQQVFKSIAYPKPWDGSHNGKPLPSGTYYYVIQLNDGQKPRSGSVTLIK
jgi:gliding motility-associated-like protein